MLSAKQYKFAKRNKFSEIAKLTTINEHEENIMTTSEHINHFALLPPIRF